jgi:hypothetical protein
VQNEKNWWNFLANSRGILFLYRVNLITFICFFPFPLISFSSILIDRSVDIHLPLYSYFSFTLKNLCKCHSEDVVTREQQFKLWAQLPNALFQHLFKSASDVTTDWQSLSIFVVLTHVQTCECLCMWCRKINRDRLYTCNYTTCYKLLRMYRCQHRSPTKEFNWSELLLVWGY